MIHHVLPYKKDIALPGLRLDARSSFIGCYPMRLYSIPSGLVLKGRCTLGLDDNPTRCNVGLDANPTRCNVGLDDNPTRCSVGLDDNPTRCNVGLDANPTRCNVGLDANPTRCNVGLDDNPTRCKKVPKGKHKIIWASR